MGLKKIHENLEVQLYGGFELIWSYRRVLREAWILLGLKCLRRFGEYEGFEGFEGFEGV